MDAAVHMRAYVFALNAAAHVFLSASNVSDKYAFLHAWPCTDGSLCGQRT